MIVSLGLFMNLVCLLCRKGAIFCIMFYLLEIITLCYAKDSSKDSKTLTIKSLQAPQAALSHGTNIYISNAGIYQNGIRTENGFITKIDKKGKILESKFIDNLGYPSGLGIIDNVLYIADIDSIKGFSLGSKKQVFSLQIKGAMFLCDVVVRGSEIFVSDSKAGLIYIVDVKKKTYHTFVAIESSLGHPNGLELRDNFLYVVTSDSTRFDTLSGNVFRIDLESKSVYLISSYKNSLYGVEITSNGLLVGGYDSDEKRARFYKITNDSKIYEIDLNVKLESVGLFTYDLNALYIPDYKLNAVLKLTP